MSFRVVVTPTADTEAMTAFRWYVERSPAAAPFRRTTHRHWASTCVSCSTAAVVAYSASSLRSTAILSPCSASAIVPKARSSREFRCAVCPLLPWLAPRTSHLPCCCSMIWAPRHPGDHALSGSASLRPVARAAYGPLSIVGAVAARQTACPPLGIPHAVHAACQTGRWR